MAILTVLTWPDSRLRKRAKPVDVVDEDISTLCDDMLETMYAAPGIGLAAIQVNVQKQIVVIDISEDKDQPLCLINPKITHQDGEEVMQEGCLSVPGYYEDISRAKQVTVQALDKHGQSIEIEADELLAVCIQHELDHLEGKLFIDYLSALKRQRIRKKLEKEKKNK